MKELTQDNDPLPFLTLAACTRNVMEFLKLQNSDKNQAQDNRRGDNAGHEKQKKSDQQESREYVDQRSRELAAFERRAGGNRKRGE